MTVKQKTQITQVIHETHVEPVRDVSFDISVGVEVPRHKIRLHRVPARIVKIVPAYESYEYFVLSRRTHRHRRSGHFHDRCDPRSLIRTRH